MIALRTLAATGLACLLVTPSSAQLAAKTLPFAKPGHSAWETVKGGRLRLVTAPADAHGKAAAAIEIELEPGFKTYWRNPGKDGIPPQVSFFGSRNVATTQMNLPPPHVFREANVTVGYKDSVAFPVAVAVETPGRPFRLVAQGVLGFCADICVPVPFRLEASSPEAGGASETASTAAPKLFPPTDAFHLKEARYDPAANRLEVDASVPDTDVLLELVVAQAPGLDLPPAAATVHQKGESATFAFELKEDTVLPDGQELDFTMIVAHLSQPGRIGIEQKVTVARVE